MPPSTPASRWISDTTRDALSVGILLVPHARKIGIRRYCQGCGLPTGPTCECQPARIEVAS